MTTSEKILLFQEVVSALVPFLWAGVGLYFLKIVAEAWIDAEKESPDGKS